AVATVVGFQLVAGAVAVDVEVVHADLAPYRGRAEQVDALGGDGDAHLQPAELGGYAELPERADVPEVEARDVVGAEGLAAGDGAGSDVEVLFFKAQAAEVRHAHAQPVSDRPAEAEPGPVFLGVGSELEAADVLLKPRRAGVVDGVAHVLNARADVGVEELAGHDLEAHGNARLIEQNHARARQRDDVAPGAGEVQAVARAVGGGQRAELIAVGADFQRIVGDPAQAAGVVVAGAGVVHAADHGAAHQAGARAELVGPVVVVLGGKAAANQQQGEDSSQHGTPPWLEQRMNNNQ